MFLALTLPMLPQIEISFAAGDEGGDTINITNITNGDYATLPVSGNDSVSISDIENAYIDAPGANITIQGDYYQQGYQYDPKVGELWSGNSQSESLWVPTASELSKKTVATIMHAEGYAMLYDGWLDLANANAIKPYGATRFGEVLGYDVYARDGETYVKNADGSISNPSARDWLSYNTPVTYKWAVTNAYRAVGVEHTQVWYQTYFNGEGADTTLYTGLLGKPRTYKWDINSSPLSLELAGNIKNVTHGADYPIVGVWASRTHPDAYVTQANTDLLNINIEDGEIQFVEFCNLVADLMHLYGEPVITDQEKYMLLEAYGRDLPYDLAGVQLDAVEYLLCRGILDSPTSFELDDGTVIPIEWHTGIRFDVAATILMRVKDTGSRLTFKEFQLTTDLELLSKGYYPTEVAVAPQLDGYSIMANTPDYTRSEYYDYYVKRADNRALFVTTNNGEAVPDTVPPIVATGDQDWNQRLYGSSYLGVTDLGWYHFRVPILPDQDVIYINSTNSQTDDPEQYVLQQGGGRYVMGTSGASITGTRTPFTEADDVALVDRERWQESSESSTAQNAATNNQLVTDFDITISKDVAGMINKTATTTMWEWWQNHVDGATYASNAQADGVTFNVKAGLNSTGYVNLHVTADKGTSAGTVKKALGLDTVRGDTLNRLLSEEDNPVVVTEAFALRNSRYIVSVDYLKTVGYIDNWTVYGDGRFYFTAAVPVPTGDANIGISTSYADVYVNTTGEYPTCTYGAQYIRMPKNVVAVYLLDGVYYLDLSIVQGRFGSAQAISLKAEDGTELLTNQPSYGNKSVVTVRQDGGATAHTFIDIGGKQFLDMSGINWSLNVIAYVDTSEGGTPDIQVFTLWETGNVVQGNDDPQRQAFSRCFGMLPASDTTWVTQAAVNPEFAYSDGQSVEGRTVLYTPSNQVLLLPGKTSVASLSTFYDTGLYQDRTKPFQLAMDDDGTQQQCQQTMVTNWMYKADVDKYVPASLWRAKSGTRLEVYVGPRNDNVLASGPRSITDDSSLITDAPSIKYAVFGLPAIVSACAVEVDRNAPFLNAVNDVTLYAGPSRLTGDIGAFLDTVDGMVYILHAASSRDASGARVYAAVQTVEFVSTDTSITGVAQKPSWQKGEPNAITDWLAWLKEAKLSDAEDVLTICIIAVLNLLPRLFMFLFIILMALSMIASVKPWQVFCDKVFDPYKFISAGRMTVHTVDIKKVVLCSMIALCMYGLFQNGLILELIAWCTRAVTGILNR